MLWLITPSFFRGQHRSASGRMLVREQRRRLRGHPAWEIGVPMMVTPILGPEIFSSNLEVSFAVARPFPAARA